MDTRTERPIAWRPIDLASEPDFILGKTQVSPSSREVFRGNEHELLEPRLMQVLVALFKAHGKVVSRDELIARCWEGRIVGEDAINRAISRLRRLSEVDHEASFQLETIPRVGYRLMPGRSSAANQTGPATGGGAAVTKRKWSPLLVLAAMAAIVLAAVLYWFYPRPVPVVANSQQSGPSRPSVAVLPFLNLSGDPNEEFFSDGMTEEITTALAQVKNLRVMGRTSAFAFKGKNEDLRAIGRKLGATHLIEGSVRKEGDHLRITVQLIKAEDDSHLWAQNYDRDLKDVFAVQEDIARTVAASLQVPLGLKQGETLISDRAIDSESHQGYLRAKALIRVRQIGVTSMDIPIALLESVVAKQPDYAPAWGLLAEAYTFTPNFSRKYIDSLDVLSGAAHTYLPKAMAAAQHGIALDPRNAEVYAGLARAQALSGKWLEAENSYNQALKLDPLNPDTLNLYAAFLYTVGRTAEAAVISEKAYALDPLSSVIGTNYANAHLAVGDNVKALAVAKHAQYAQFLAAQAYAALGRFRDAAEELESMTQRDPMAQVAANIIRSFPATAPSNTPYLRNFSFVFAYTGHPERTFEWAEHNVNAGYFAGQFNWFWQPNYAASRKAPRFKPLIRKLGLIDYWRIRGWPDFCHPVGTDDFACI